MSASFDVDRFEALVDRTQGHPSYLESYAVINAASEDTSGYSESPTHKVIALDCEMVCTEDNPMELARVSVVDINGEVTTTFNPKLAHIFCYHVRFR